MSTTTDEARKKGFDDAAHWMAIAPEAEVQELAEELEDRVRRCAPQIIWPDHSLAKFWGHDGPADTPAGDVAPESAYGQGFMEALRGRTCCEGGRVRLRCQLCPKSVTYWRRRQQARETATTKENTQ